MMRKYVLYSLLIISLSLLSHGQASYTNVTATLVDSSAQTWANATVVATLRPAPNNPAVPLNNGLPITDSPQTAITNGSGTFTMTLDDTSHITPAGATWIFNIFPNATVPNANSITLAVTGANLNLSGPLSSILTPPNVFASPVINRAYTDSQVNGGTGGIYWNTTSNTIRGCVFVSGSCNWVDIGNLSAPGSHFFIPYNNGGGAFTASANLQFNDVTNTFTTPNAVFATQAQSAIFGSTSANAATSGFIRRAAGDTDCFRNAANNGNLCLSKNGSDQFTLWGALLSPSLVSPSSTGTDSGTETLVNKTLTAPTITNPSTTGTDSGTETLVNKTLTAPVITNPTTTGTDGGAETLNNKTLGSPVINGSPTGTGLQGTEAKLATADSLSGGTGAPVCVSSSSGLTTTCTGGLVNYLSATTSGKLFQAGIASSTNSVTFPTAFSSGTPVVLVNARQGFTDVHVTGVTTTGFTVDFSSTFGWMAFGIK